jgi:hypothetical protein
MMTSRSTEHFWSSKDVQNCKYSNFYTSKLNGKAVNVGMLAIKVAVDFPLWVGHIP